MPALSDEEIAAEEEFLKGLPRINWGALLMPGIWGPVHGFWICILFYPLWLLVDNLIYGAYSNPQPLSIFLAVVSGIAIIALTVGFSMASQPIAAHRAQDAGVSRQAYLKRQQIWTAICLVLAIVVLIWASYYNIYIREPW